MGDGTRGKNHKRAITIISYFIHCKCSWPRRRRSLRGGEGGRLVEMKSCSSRNVIYSKAIYLRLINFHKFFSLNFHKFFFQYEFCVTTKMIFFSIYFIPCRLILLPNEMFCDAPVNAWTAAATIIDATNQRNWKNDRTPSGQREPHLICHCPGIIGLRRQ